MGVESPYRIARKAGRITLLVLFAALATVMAVTAQETRPSEGPAIVGGREADPGEWPWQVALIRSGGDPYWDQFCGGSLIAPLWVVTAAHCAAEDSAADIQVLAGIHDLQSLDSGYVNFDVKRIIVHPAYEQLNEYDSDIALLELASPAPFRAAGPDQLPIAGIAPVAEGIGSLAGVESSVTGWGNRSGHGIDYPARLHEVEVPIWAQEACEAAYPAGVTANMLCAGLPEGGKDSCQGDSGGPLVVYDAEQAQWQLAGITSWGFGCAEPGLPGVYTRVERFTGWIADVVGGTYNPDFGLSVSPSGATACAGINVNATIAVESHDGFAAPVDLALAGLPSGASYEFQPPGPTPPGSSELTIYTAGLPAGDYELLIHAVGQGLTHDAVFTLTVATRASPQPDMTCALLFQPTLLR